MTRALGLWASIALLAVVAFVILSAARATSIAVEVVSAVSIVLRPWGGVSGRRR